MDAIAKYIFVSAQTVVANDVAAIGTLFPMNWKCKFFSKLSIVDFHKIIYSPISVPIV
jgi:hypothetical protein